MKNRSPNLKGNGSFRFYSHSDLWSFRSYSLSVRSFRPGSFWSNFGVGPFGPISVVHLNLVITRSAGARQRTVLVNRTVLKRTSKKLTPSD